MSCQKWCIKNFFVISLLTMTEVTNFSTTTNPHSGLTIDAGQGLTFVNNRTTVKGSHALEHEILKLLGFPEKPKTTSGRAPLVKRSAPNFLLNVYETQKNANKTLESSKKFDMIKRELIAIDQSDVIITFTAQQPHHGAGGKPDRIKRIWFDVSTIPEHDNMTSAELRLYRGSNAKNQKNRGGFTITVYRVTKLQNGDRDMLFVDAVNTSAGHEGWIVLNVTESLNHWMTNSTENRGLYLSVRSIDGNDRETRPDDIGIVGFKGDVELQPFMAGYFKTNGLVQTRIDLMTFNALDDLETGGSSVETVRSRRSDDSIVDDWLKRRTGTRTSYKMASKCDIRSLYVSFKDLQWQDWIIAPEGYDAYYCDGSCDFPINARVNLTNHAIIQSLAHHLRPDKVPKPCCTPTKLSSISVLYFLDDNNVILRKYKNMVVRGCGCGGR